MDIAYQVLRVIGIILLFIGVSVLLFGLMQILLMLVRVYKTRKKYKNYNVIKKLDFKRHVIYSFFRTKYIFPVELIKWIALDISKGKVRLKLFGIWCLTGYFGQGKTLGGIMYANQLKKTFAQMGLYVHIYTNFNLRGQDGKITCWQDLLNLPPRTIVIFDEIQSTFTSQKFKDFPIDLLWKITQCRKQELCILASSPVFSRMSIQLRENTDMIVLCKNVLKLDRWFNYKFYNAPEYERYMDNPLQMLRICQRSMNVVAQDWDFAQYDTKQIVDRFDIVAVDETKTDKNKKVTSNEYKKLRDEILKEVDERLKKLKIA